MSKLSDAKGRYEPDAFTTAAPLGDNCLAATARFGGHASVATANPE